MFESILIFDDLMYNIFINYFYILDHFEVDNMVSDY